jgi:HEAT repeat protein
MRTLGLQAALCSVAFVCFSALCVAHGGQYLGPGDIVPPGGGGGGGSSGGPNGPTTGQPTGPRAPAPSGPSSGRGSPSGTGSPTGGGAGRGGRTGGGSPIEFDDLTTWDYWWEFNKDPYLRLKDAVHQGGPITGDDDHYLGKRRETGRDSVKPTSTEIQVEILPALKKAIDSTENRDIASSCMIAMAKVGTDHPDFTLASVFAPRLRRPDQEVRETAALALGIAAIAGETEIELLHGLALDTAVGRQAVAQDSVDVRTRSFAIYGLGLLAHRHADTTLKRRAFTVMQRTLEDRTIGNRNLKVAAIQGIGILNVGSATPAAKELLADSLACLEAYFGKDLGAGEQLIQAHCPTAIAKLIGRDHEASARWKATFAAELQKTGSARRSNEVTQSCAMALGRLVRPIDEVDFATNPDAKYGQLLLDTYRDHRDAQTRWFAILGLGQIGGTWCRTTLLRAFDQGTQNQQKPWCALALGVMAFHRAEEQRKAQQETAPDGLVTKTLADAFAVSKDPSLAGAIAISLGLTKAQDTADSLRARMLASMAQERLAGHLCIGLALMNATGAIEDIRLALAKPSRGGELLPQAAIALGKLGDKQVAEDLQKILTGENLNLATLAAAASAIGFIGDRRSIVTLKNMLFDTRLSHLARAFAAVALGGIADKEPLPWNSKIGAHSNYRASVETLTNAASGILDIL